MKKIVRVTNDYVFIGVDDGKVIKVDKKEFDWDPVVGEQVEVYNSDNDIIVTKIENEKAEKKEEPISKNEGINIVVNNASNNTAPEYSTSGKTTAVVNKLVYILLAFFLGGLGVHKFYAKQSSTGIMYLLFCWTFIPAILAFVDAISACTKPADNNGNILI